MKFQSGDRENEPHVNPPVAKKLSERPVFIPFGAYSTDKEAKPPINEAYVGREKERANFMRTLLNSGKSGAYLVTGQRGTGKTSFVDYCLREYDNCAFQRYIRGNAGKFAIDRLLAVVTVFAMITITFLLAELVDWKNPDNWYKNYILTIPIGLIVFTLLKKAYRTFELILSLQKPTTHQYIIKVSTWFPLILFLLFTTYIFSEHIKYLFIAFTIQLVCLSAIFDFRISYLLRKLGNQDVDIPSFKLGYMTEAARFLTAITTLFMFGCAISTGILLSYLFEEFNSGLFEVLILLASLFFFYSSGKLIKHKTLNLKLKRKEEDHDAFSGTNSNIQNRMQFISILSYSVLVLLVLLGDFSTPESAGITCLILLSNLLTPLLFSFTLSIRSEKKFNDLVKKIGAAVYFQLNVPVEKVRLLREFHLLIIKSSMYLILAFLILQNLLPFDFLYADNSSIRSSLQQSWFHNLYPFFDLEPKIREHGDLNIITIISIICLIAVIALLENDWFIKQMRMITEEESLRRWVPDTIYDIPQIFQRDTKYLAIQSHTKHTEDVNINAQDKVISPKDEKQEVQQIIANIETEKHRVRTLYSSIVNDSIINYYFKFWRPTLQLNINLGFDEVKHKTIILNLLEKLHDSYKNLFYTFDNTRFIIIKTVAIFIISLFSLQICKALFDFRVPEYVGKYEFKAPRDEENIANLESQTLQLCQQLKNSPMAVSSPVYEVLSAKSVRLECFPGNNVRFKIVPLKYYGLSTKSNRAYKFLLSILYIKVISFDSEPSAELTLSKASDLLIPSINNIFNQSGNLYDLSKSADRIVIAKGQKTIMGYHIFVTVFFYLFFKFINNYFPLVPFRRNLDEIKFAIDSIKSKNVRKSNFTIRSLLPITSFNSTNGSEKITEPVDARVVENHLIKVLEVLAKDSVNFFDGVLSVPSPDITIVFDELDKLGTEIPIKEDESPKSKEYHFNNESQRSEKIKALMSDLKGIITSKYCKFVFIGGRHLYDEWLGDKTKRDQLMPSIFDRQFYLRTLIEHQNLEHEHDGKDSFSYYVRLYLAQQYKRSILMFDHLVQIKNFLSWSGRNNDKSSNVFANLGETKGASAKIFNRGVGFDIVSQIKMTDDSEILEIPIHKTDFMSKFSNYLAFRSHGIPKRLQEILSNHMLPIGTALNLSGMVLQERQNYNDESLRHFKRVRNCNDVLFFNDIDILKVQLIDYLYKQIADILENKLKERDDKVITSTFSISDYIFKFHNRAFTWESLEKIDDLVDINRAPDIRQLLFEFVDSMADVVFHKILNGMYTYRFKSHIAKEIEYISHYASDEGAALNFTLDESQALKRIYYHKLNDGKAGNPELISYYAELFEFDQEYETARKEYSRALEIIDTNIKQLIGSPSSDVDSSVISLLLTGKADNLIYRHIVTWSTFRMRLLLQIGLSYELTRNLEKAESVYMEALEFSKALIEQHDKQINSFYGEEFDTTNFYTKHFHLLYQPVFALSWIAEKYHSAVDTSASLLHSMIGYYEERLPFKLQPVTLNTYNDISPTKIAHSNFALIKSEIRNKAGDLFFFKGSQRTNKWHEEECLPDDRRFKDYGYLLKSHYHYAVGLHYLRHYNIYRFLTSGHKFGLDNQFKTFHRDQFQEFILLSMYSGLADLSESILARIDFSNLILEAVGDEKGVLKQSMLLDNCKEITKPALNDYCNKCYECIEDWFSFNDGEINEKVQGVRHDDMELIIEWLGKVSDDKSHTLSFPEKESSNVKKLVVYLALNQLSCRYMSKAGYIEDAAFEFLLGLDSIDFVLKLIYMSLRDSGICSSAIDAHFPQWKSLKNPNGSLLDNLSELQKNRLCELLNFLFSNAVSRIQKILGLYRIKKAKTIDYDALLELVPERYITLFISIIFQRYRFSLLLGPKSIENFFSNEDDVHIPYITQDVNYLHKVIIATCRRYVTSSDFLNVLKRIKPELCSKILEDYDANSENPSHGNINYHRGEPKLKYAKLIEDVIELKGVFNFNLQNEFNDNLDIKEHRNLVFEILLIALQRFIEIHRFPILNRLNALVVLSDIQNTIVRSNIREAIKDDSETKWKLHLSGIEWHNSVELDKPTSLFISRYLNIPKSSLVKNIDNEEQLNKEYRAIESFLKYLFSCVKRSEIYANEIHELNDKYNSSFHFIPLRSGFNYYHLAKLYLRIDKYFEMLVVLCEDIIEKCPHEKQKNRFSKIQGLVYAFKTDIAYFQRDNYKYGDNNSITNTADEWLDQAKEDLYKSQQMYTMRREYYESISEMYYLYDDFNDRHIHHGHALQMMSSEIAYLVEKEIDKIEDKHLKEQNMSKSSAN